MDCINQKVIQLELANSSSKASNKVENIDRFSYNFFSFTCVRNT